MTKTKLGLKLTWPTFLDAIDYGPHLLESLLLDSTTQTSVQALLRLKAAKPGPLWYSATVLALAHVPGPLHLKSPFHIGVRPWAHAPLSKQDHIVKALDFRCYSKKIKEEGNWRSNCVKSYFTGSKMNKT